MRTSPLDFLLCGFVISFILIASFALTHFGVSPLIASYLGSYTVIFNFFFYLFSYGIISGMIIQILIRVKPLQLGEFPMDHPNFTYWKLLTITYRLGEFFLLPFTTVFTKPLVVKLFGAKIGKNVAIGGTIDDPYLISIGDGAIIGQGSLVSGNASMNSKIVFGKVIIGKGVTISVNSVVLPTVEIGDNSVLSIGSVLLSGSVIPKEETWRGNPARKWQAMAASNS
jgi:hypothetical protein